MHKRHEDFLVPLRETSHSLQLQSLWIIRTAAVSKHVFPTDPWARVRPRLDPTPRTRPTRCAALGAARASCTAQVHISTGVQRTCKTAHVYSAHVTTRVHNARAHRTRASYSSVMGTQQHESLCNFWRTYAVARSARGAERLSPQSVSHRVSLGVYLSVSHRSAGALMSVGGMGKMLEFFERDFKVRFGHALSSPTSLPFSASRLFLLFLLFSSSLLPPSACPLLAGSGGPVVAVERQ